MKQTAFTIKQKWKTYCHSALLTGTSFNNISNSVEISDNLLGRNITVVHHQLATQVVRIHATLTSELHRLCQDPQTERDDIARRENDEQTARVLYGMHACGPCTWVALPPRSPQSPPPQHLRSTNGVSKQTTFFDEDYDDDDDSTSPLRSIHLQSIQLSSRTTTYLMFTTKYIEYVIDFWKIWLETTKENVIDRTGVRAQCSALLMPLVEEIQVG
ncbi:hypothetical protein QE152_g25224 [Popillia japonica]|uniref:Uncharacterized protein n=1 Tax=Popillia japonica TaxID=7064 RepID=A0AAW1K138_POPJA